MEWRIRLLQYGALLAEQHAEVTLDYLRRGSELVGLIGNGPEALARFENWFKAGMEVAAYSPEGARAYFAVESRKALASVEQALSGVPFRQVARTSETVRSGALWNRRRRDGASRFRGFLGSRDNQRRWENHFIAGAAPSVCNGRGK